MTFADWSRLKGVRPDGTDWTEDAGSGSITLTATALKFLGDAKMTRALGNVTSASHLDSEVRVELASYSAAGWASGAPPVGILLCDSTRELAVVVGGTTVKAVDSSGAIVASADYPVGTRPFDLRVRKWSAAWWIVEVDGKELLRIAYERSGTASLPWGFATVGILDAGATGADLRITAARVSVDAFQPQSFLLDRFIARLPAKMQQAWGNAGDALLRGMAGVYSTVDASLSEAWLELQAAREVVSRFELTGLRAPTAESPAWTVTGTASLVRQRIRFAAGSNLQRAVATFPALSVAPTPAATESTIEASVIWTSGSPGADDELGPLLELFTGARAVRAALYAADAGSWRSQAAVWAFTDGVNNAATGRLWRVNAGQEHTVQLRAEADGVVLLLVDGCIVDRALLTDFPLSSTSARAHLTVQQDGTCANVVCDFANVVATREVFSREQRAMLYQTAIERLVFRGGCESNGELETWKRARLTNATMRGTGRGIVIELERLTCNASVIETDDGESACWYLDRSFPDVTPIYLDSAGATHRTTYEFPAQSLLLTPTDIARLALRYIVPMSTAEFVYRVGLYTLLTSSSSSAGAGLISFDVTRTLGFAVGDTVELVSSAGYEVAEITDITGLTITTTRTAAAWSSGDRMRIILGTS
jgi:hypothetical protein